MSSSPHPPSPTDPLPIALGRLEDRLEEIGADSSAGPEQRARRLAEIEAELGATLAAAAGDLALARRRGHPIITAISEWGDDAARLGCSDAAAEAEALVERCLHDEGRAWSRMADRWLTATNEDVARNATAIFRHLLAATALRREALCLDRDEAAATPIDVARRDALRDALAATDPTPAEREAWIRDLIDRADDVLTGMDELGPSAAARNLELVADDLAWHHRHVERKGAAARRLGRKLRRLRVEAQERRLQESLERRFGATAVGRFERFVLLLIFVVLGILVVEFAFDVPLPVQIALTAIDTFACGVFLTEFFVRLSLVRGRASWARRHVLIDFVPSLPFGLFTLYDKLGTAEQLRWGRALRFLRLTRVARYVRLLLPLIRMIRAFGFLVRGLDRLVRRYGDLLNRNVILFPRRDERAAAARLGESGAAHAARLRTALDKAWRTLVEGSPESVRGALFVERTRALEAMRERGGLERPDTAEAPTSAPIELPAEQFFDRMERVTAEELAAEYGFDFVARCARAARLFARPPIRWFPILRRAVPRLTPTMGDAEVVAAAAHALGRELRRHHDRILALGDLHGTVTPPELVDRVGTMMFRASLRPARKLLVIGGVFLVIQGIAGVFGVGAGWVTWIERLIGDTLLLLGGICLVVLGVGWWLRSLAGRETAFHEQVALAQYLSLTESIKGRFLARDVAIFDRRVLEPESRVTSDVPKDSSSRRDAFLRIVRSWLVEPPVGRHEGVAEALERTALLYRDSLDGSLFGEDDDRTTAHLLGDPSLRELRRLAATLGKREHRELVRLDLRRKRTLLGGPWLWFSFISKAITQDVGRLIVDYNRHAITLAELPNAEPDERAAYERWLAAESAAAETKRRTSRNIAYQTTSFHALHFLDADPARDGAIAAAYGDAIARKLAHDRRVLIREIFGTFPRHLRSKERRVANLFRLYGSWLQGGRGLLLPLRLGVIFLRSVWIGATWLASAVGEIRRSNRRFDPEAVEQADFATAVRKIGRVRGPIVATCIALRARLDPEYLGVRPPGLEGTASMDDVRADLGFADVSPERRRDIAAQRLEAEADMRRLAAAIDEGLLDRLAERRACDARAFDAESRRALAVAYRGDYAGIKTHLSSTALLQEALASLVDRPPGEASLLRRWRLARPVRRWWAQYGRGDRAARKRFARVVAGDGTLRRALVAWAERGTDGAREEGLRRAADLLRHPRRISEQLLTLRTVQTLSLVDLLNYRTHVYRLGDYEGSGDDPRHWLRLGSDDDPAARAGAAASRSGSERASADGPGRHAPT